jgi:hypothetical protein
VPCERSQKTIGATIPGGSPSSALHQAGEETLAKSTLTNLYNARPTWLANAHATLDAAVLDAYGWPVDLPDAEILERLLTLNLHHAAAERAPAGQPAAGRPALPMAAEDPAPYG